MATPKTTDPAPPVVSGPPDPTNDGPTPKPVDPPICVPCYRGVWPLNAHKASCSHGKWERPDPTVE
jgi:hypothetical protein